jgi:hypothetical protein
MKKTVLIFILTSFFFSCKKEESVEEINKVEEDLTSFNVILDVIIKKDDDISLFYTTDGSLNFKEPILQGVKGSESTQQIVFKLPENVKPTQFRIDFGLNPEQEDMYFNKITFKYIGKERVISCPELSNFFRANDNYCSFDPVTGLIKSKNFKDNTGKSFFPSIYPHENNLKPELEKLY